MNLTRDRIRSIGWAFILTICIALSAALMLRVNAVKGQVHEAESRIVSLKRQIGILEIEFQTRANQQQLDALNAVEFGYSAPGAGQYIEGERQLAAFGKPRGPGAPSPIRMSSTVTGTGAGGKADPFIAMVSPLGGAARTVEDAPAATGENVSETTMENADPASLDDVVGSSIASAELGERLARIQLSGGAEE